MKKNGFTILEMTVAIFIMTVSMTGAFLLIDQTFSTASHNQNQLIASYLAQEGLELVRNKRDENWMNGDDWDEGFNLVPGETKNYEIDYKETPLTEAVSFRELYLDSGGFYGYPVSVNKTNFKRKIQITKEGNYLMEILVIVEWQEKENLKTVEAGELLYNWYEQ